MSVGGYGCFAVYGDKNTTKRERQNQRTDPKRVPFPTWIPDVVFGCPHCYPKTTGRNVATFSYCTETIVVNWRSP